MKLPAIFFGFVFLCCCVALAIAAQRDDAREARIKRVVGQAMGQLPGTAVVLDVGSGKLIAGHRMEVAARRLVRPGSAVKPLTLMALIDGGVVQPRTRIVCRRSVRIAGRALDCSHPDVPEPMDGTLALAYSCNHFFVHVAESLAPDTLVTAFREAGLASRTGLSADEVPGVVQRPATRESLQLMAIGEEGVQVTPLGLAVAYKKLALRVRNGEGALKPIVDGMTGAVQFGTGQRAGVDGIAVAGKTGTSPTPDRLRTHAWFAGFVPADRPEIVVVVFLEQGTGGSDAAPIAGQILAAYR